MSIEGIESAHQVVAPAAETSPRESKTMASPSSKLWHEYRREIRFLALFLVILGGGFTLLSLNSINDHAIEPFTAAIARVSGWTLNLIGQDVTLRETAIHSSRFAVNIRNGCNGVETMIIFLAAVLAFPASWGSRLIGLAVGVVAIQAVNLVRVVALFLTGVYFPDFFDASHTTLWQTVVILFGVLLWVYWANRFAVAPAAVPAASGGPASAEE